MFNFYIQGVLVAFILATLKVLANVHMFRQPFSSIVIGCLIFALPSWLTVAHVIYWEIKRQLH